MKNEKFHPDTILLGKEILNTVKSYISVDYKTVCGRIPDNTTDNTTQIMFYTPILVWKESMLRVSFEPRMKERAISIHNTLTDKLFEFNRGCMGIWTLKLSPTENIALWGRIESPPELNYWIEDLKAHVN